MVCVIFNPLQSLTGGIELRPSSLLLRTIQIVCRNHNTLCSHLIKHLMIPAIYSGRLSFETSQTYHPHVSEKVFHLRHQAILHLSQLLKRQPLFSLLIDSKLSPVEPSAYLHILIRLPHTHATSKIHEKQNLPW